MFIDIIAPKTVTVDDAITMNIKLQEEIDDVKLQLIEKNASIANLRKDNAKTEMELERLRASHISMNDRCDKISQQNENQNEKHEFLMKSAFSHDFVSHF